VFRYRCYLYHQVEIDIIYSAAVSYHHLSANNAMRMNKLNRANAVVSFSLGYRLKGHRPRQAAGWTWTNEIIKKCCTLN
jgi:hypothetical protein